MTLLAPGFFLGLAALGVPLWVHLRRRSQRRVLNFPSLMFLADLPYKSLRRRRLQHLLLLAARMGVISLVVLGFVGPVWRATQAGATTTESRLDLYLVDRSASMAVGGRMARAVAAIREDLARQEGRATAAALIAFDESAEVLVPPGPMDRALWNTALDGLRPSAWGTRYDSGVRLAGSQALQGVYDSCRVILVSDFQRAPLEERFLNESLLRGCSSTALEVGEPLAGRNLGILAVTLNREVSPTGTRERVVVEATISGLEDPSSAAVESGDWAELEIDGRAVGRRPLSSTKQGRLVFEPFTLSGDLAVRGTVRLSPDKFPLDDQLRFVASPSSSARLLWVDGGNGSGGSSFARRAVALAREPRIQWTERRDRSISLADIEQATVVVLAGLAFEPAVALRLWERVEAGEVGVLVLASGLDSNRRSLGSIEHPIARLGERQLERQGKALAFVDTEHPVFAPFARLRSTDFSSVRVYAYRPTAIAEPGDLEPDAPPPVVLARLEDGRPLMTETRRGRGRVLLWGSTIEPSACDLPLQAAFVPWFDRVVRHLADYSEAPVSYVVGQLPPVGSRSESSSRRWAGGMWEPSPSGDPRFDREGFVEIKTAQGEKSFAVNVNREESSLERFDAEELLASLLVPVSGGVVPSAAAEVNKVPRGADPGQTRQSPVGSLAALDVSRAGRNFAWPFVVLGALVLLLEGWLNVKRKADPYPAETTPGS